MVVSAAEDASASRIRVIAICVFRRGRRILVQDGFDSVKDSPYYRPLGGEVQWGETSCAAIEREILEEIGHKATGLELLGVLEYQFTCDGKQGHEIAFVYDGRLPDAAATDANRVVGAESDGTPITAEWRGIDWFDEHERLVPEGLLELLSGEA